MILLGLTGGVAMGKTTAAAYLQQLGLPVVDCDVLARQLVEPGEPALEEIRNAFGTGVFCSTGGLDRARLGEIVFADPAKRRLLESILHPRIRQRWMSETETWRTAGQPCGVVVIPLLFETEAAGWFQGTICVACSGQTQRRRLAARGHAAADIAQRLAAQWPIERKMEAASFVAWNDHTEPLLARQLDAILSSVRSMPPMRNPARF